MKTHLGLWIHTSSCLLSPGRTIHQEMDTTVEGLRNDTKGPPDVDLKSQESSESRLAGREGGAPWQGHGFCL